MSETQNSEDEKSDELLKLSEALFAQDIELLRNNEKLGKIENKGKQNRRVTIALA